MVAKEKIAIFLIEDDPDDQYLFRLMLSKDRAQEYEITCFSSLNECIESDHSRTPDLIILDLILPDSEGEETLTTILDNYRHTPVIVLTGAEQGNLGERAVSMGAQDYILKSDLSQNMLAQAVRYALERYSLIQELHKKAITDHLTGLLNRAAFIERLSHELKHADRYNHRCAVVSIDLDNFKGINDTHGHAEGDEILRVFAGILKGHTRQSDTPARFGGDEFVVLLSRLNSDDEALKIVREKHTDMVAALDEHTRDKPEIQKCLGLSMGVAVYPDHGGTVDQLLVAADKALYKSKNEGKNCYSFSV